MAGAGGGLGDASDGWGGTEGSAGAAVLAGERRAGGCRRPPGSIRAALLGMGSCGGAGCVPSGSIPASALSGCTALLRRAVALGKQFKQRRI